MSSWKDGVAEQKALTDAEFAKKHPHYKSFAFTKARDQVRSKYHYPAFAKPEPRYKFLARVKAELKRLADAAYEASKSEGPNGTSEGS